MIEKSINNNNNENATTSQCIKQKSKRMVAIVNAHT